MDHRALIRRITEYFLALLVISFVSYRPPVDLKTMSGIESIKPNGNKEIVLNFITPHQKWGIHSTLQQPAPDAWP